MKYIGRYLLPKFGGDGYGYGIKIIHPRITDYTNYPTVFHNEQVWYDNCGGNEGQRVLIGLNNINNNVSDANFQYL